MPGSSLDCPPCGERLGELYLRSGQNEEAEKFFQQGLKRNPRLPASLLGLAKIFMQQERYRDALTTIDSAVRLAPDHEAMHFVRGQVLMRLGRGQEAQAEYATAQKILNSSLNKRRESLGDDRVPNPELAEPPQ